MQHNTYKEEPLDAAARKFEDCRTAQRHLRHDDYMQHMRDVSLCESSARDATSSHSIDPHPDHVMQKAETERGLQWSRAVRYAMAAQVRMNGSTCIPAEAELID
jgi:hypothetical protein